MLKFIKLNISCKDNKQSYQLFKNQLYIITKWNQQKYTCSVQLTNYTFWVNRPINGSPQYFLYNNTMYYVDFTTLTILNNYNSDPKYVACATQTKSKIPQLAASTILSVYTTPMSIGQRYYISTQRGSDYYSINVLYTNQNTVFIIEIKKNQIVLYTQNYNYNSDSLFFPWYLTSINASKVLNPPGLGNVTLKYTGNVKYFKVIYSPLQYMQFNYNMTSNTLKLVSYTVDNYNLLDLLNIVGATDKRNESQVYLQYLRRKNLTNQWSFIQSFLQNAFGANLTWVTSQGTFNTNIKKQNNTNITIDNILQISTKTCFDINTWNSNNKIKSIDSYLRSFYNLLGYNIQLVQTKVNNVGNRYRLLYTNNRLRQIQFIVEQLYTLYNVIKATALNNGYAFVQPLPHNIDYQKMLTFLAGSNLNGNKVPILTQNNSVAVRSYYNDGKSTYEIVLTRSNNAAALTVVASRNYLLVPEGFNLGTLLIPGNPPLSDMDNLQIISGFLPVTYPELEGATMKFADKIDTNTYNILYKTVNNLYKKVVCGIVNSQINPVSVTDTTYTDASFGNCQAFAADGKCSSRSASQLQYQGSCWTKLQGCSYQAGAICLKCEAQYVLDANKLCKRACSELIS